MQRRMSLIALCVMLVGVAGCNKDFDTTKNGICGLKPTGGIDCDAGTGNLDVVIPAGLDATNGGHTEQYQDSNGTPVGDPINGTRVTTGLGEWVDFPEASIPGGADRVKVTVRIQGKSEPVCFTVTVV